MKYFPEQFGQVSKQQLFDLLSTQNITADLIRSKYYPEWMNQVIGATQKETSKRNEIKDVFERRRLNLKQNSEGIDFFASYCPKCKFGKEWGIYFFAGNCINAIKKLDDDSLSFNFLELILFHEISHAFIEEKMDTAVYQKNLALHKPKHCNFEEAMCNLLSLIAVGNTKMELQDNLMPKLGNGGLSGYGEYDKVSMVMLNDWKNILGDTCSTILQNAPSNDFSSYEGFLVDEWLKFHEQNIETIPIYIDTSI